MKNGAKNQQIFAILHSDSYASADLLENWNFIQEELPKIGHQYDEMDLITFLRGMSN